MKLLPVCLVIFVLSLLFAQGVYADVSPTPTTPPSQSQVETGKSTTPDGPTTILGYLITFTQGLEKIVSGGIVFQTPDVFANKIVIPNTGTIDGFSNIRTVFLAIAIFLTTALIMIKGITLFFDNNTFVMRSLLNKFIIVGILFSCTPAVLSFGIQLFNLLCQQILHLGSITTTDSALSQLSTKIFSDISDFIQKGGDPTQFGIPTMDFSLLTLFSDMMKVFITTVFELTVFLITIVFFLIGYCFILFQFGIRFFKLLVMSVLYPFIIPLALFDSTTGIVYSYYLVWLSFMVHQAAFVLGFVLVSLVFNSLLQHVGVSSGLLVLYISALFALGGIGDFVARFFGDPWAVFSTRMQAAVIGGVGIATVKDFKRGAMSGGVSGFRSLAGKTLAQKAKWLSKDGKQFSLKGIREEEKPPMQAQHTHTYDPFTPEQARGGSSPRSSQASTARSFTPSLTREMRAMGVNADVLNLKSGEVQLQKTPVYQYAHPEKPLLINYLSKSDALKDGLREDQLKSSVIEGKFADYSSFYKSGIKNPHNTIVTRKAQQQGFTGDTHIGLTGSEDRVKNHLVVGKDYFKEKGIEGIIGKRSGNYNGTQNKNGEKIIKIYTLDK